MTAESKIYLVFFVLAGVCLLQHVLIVVNHRRISRLEGER